jgi:hypothetical protein
VRIERRTFSSSFIATAGGAATVVTGLEGAAADIPTSVWVGGGDETTPGLGWYDGVSNFFGGSTIDSGAGCAGVDNIAFAGDCTAGGTTAVVAPTPVRGCCGCCLAAFFCSNFILYLFANDADDVDDEVESVS